MIDPETITASDIAVLQRWHVNLVRWGLHPYDKGDLTAYDNSLRAKLDRLDRMIPFFKKAGILIVLDMHDVPGGRDSALRCRLFQDADIEQHFCGLWDAMATRYRGEKQIWAYDLMNEPVEGSTPAGVLNWRDLAEVTARRVRKIDPQHPIIVEPAPWAFPEALATFKPLTTPGIIYSVHMYDPHSFTHQGVDSHVFDLVYPGIVDGIPWDKARIQKDFQPVVEFAAKNRARIYVGEFSAIRWASGAARYIEDVIDVMEQNHFDWTYHAFREWSGWDPEVTDDRNSTETPLNPTDRMRVLQSALARNTPLTQTQKNR